MMSSPNWEELFSPERSSQWEQHLDSCESCRQALEEEVQKGEWQSHVHLALSLDEREFGESIESQAETCDDGDPFLEFRSLLGPTDDPCKLGRIANYEIVGILGRGGMGVVFKGFDSALNRYVAIKMLQPQLATSGEARKRFAREAQAAAAVVNDYVMAIHSVAQWNGMPYFVMPYARGTSLQKRLLKDGPLEVQEILRIGHQVARGLEAAHAQGLVHRDIKPGNILSDEGVERVTLTDFGLARAVDDASLTRTGFLAGTPQYMSPEQARGSNVDFRSDLFSLGSVLYAMCTGKPPFEAENTIAILMRIASESPSPIQGINPSIPPWLIAIISKLMAKSPVDRFANACEVADVMETCLAHYQNPNLVPLPDAVLNLTSNRKFFTPAMLWIALGCLIPILFGGVVLSLELNKGTLNIECDADDTPIRIKKSDQVVDRINVSKNGKTIKVAAGEYVVEVDGEIDGIEVANRVVKLKRGSMEKVTFKHTLPAHSSLSLSPALEAMSSTTRLPLPRAKSIEALLSTPIFNYQDQQLRHHFAKFVLGFRIIEARYEQTLLQLRRELERYSSENPVVQKAREVHQRAKQEVESILWRHFESQATVGGQLHEHSWSSANYKAPDFFGFFPNDELGGMRLDQLWRSEDKDEQPVEVVLPIVRQGLIHTKESRQLILAWVGNRFIRSHSMQHPEAIEIMYHAADFRCHQADYPGMKLSAIHFGLGAVYIKSPAILRTLAELAMKSNDPKEFDSITRCTLPQHDSFNHYLKPFQYSIDPATKAKADQCALGFRGGNREWLFSETKYYISNAFKTQKSKIQESLTNGSSHDRLNALQTIFSSNFEQMMSGDEMQWVWISSKDPNPKVRELVAQLIARKWFAGRPAPTINAIQWMIQLGKDENNSVSLIANLALTRIREKTDEVIRHLIERSFEEREHHAFQAIKHSLTAHRKQVTEMLDEYRSSSDSKHASSAQNVYKELTGGTFERDRLEVKRLLHEIVVQGKAVSEDSREDFYAPSDNEVIHAYFSSEFGRIDQLLAGDGLILENVTKRKIFEKIEEPRFVPLVGNAKIEHITYSCAIKFSNILDDAKNPPAEFLVDHVRFIILSK